MPPPMPTFYSTQTPTRSKPAQGLGGITTYRSPVTILDLAMPEELILTIGFVIPGTILSESRVRDTIEKLVEKYPLLGSRYVKDKVSIGPYQTPPTS
jgi:hypothetical protein